MKLLELIEQYGPASLTDQQLFSILIGKDEAQAIFRRFDNLASLARKEWKLIAYQTYARKAALKAGAVFELSSRIEESSIDYEAQVTTPREAAAYFMPKLKNLPHEVFYVAYLNNSKMITGSDKVSHGGKTSTIVDPSEVMKLAIVNDASSILLAHNHPSGSRKESRADVQLTKRLVEAGKLLDIPVNDHIIIAEGGFTSFKSKGII